MTPILKVENLVKRFHDEMSYGQGEILKDLNTTNLTKV